MDCLLSTLKWSAVIAAAVLLVTALTPVLSRRYRAKWRYWLWLVFSVILLLAPIQWDSLLPTVVQPAVVVEIPRMESIPDSDNLTMPQSTAPDVTNETGSALPTTVTATDSKHSIDPWTIAVTVWLAGIGVFVLRILIGSMAFARQVRRWRTEPNERVLTIYKACSGNLRHVPQLWICAAVDTPMVTGLFSPRLLLPRENYTDKELGFIFRHELTHFKRHDLQYKLVLLLANAIHWFNPAVYIMLRSAERDLELTCDDTVCAGEDREMRRAYSETLLANLSQRGIPALSTHFYGGVKTMKERLHNILSTRRRNWGVSALVLVLVSVIALGTTFALTSCGTDTVSEPDSPSSSAEVPDSEDPDGGSESDTNYESDTADSEIVVPDTAIPDTTTPVTTTPSSSGTATGQSHHDNDSHHDDNHHSGTADTGTYTVPQTSDDGEEPSVSGGDSGEAETSSLQESNAREAYYRILNSLYCDHALPDGHICDDVMGNISDNTFFIGDVDCDGKEELILNFTTTITAGNLGYIIDYNEASGTTYYELCDFPYFTFYSNGACAVGASHNQGYGSMWPYTLYVYDSSSDCYTEVGMVDSWDRSIIEGNGIPVEYPEDADTSGSGVVYFISESGWPAADNPLDVTEYEAWLSRYVGDSGTVAFTALSLTEDNINAVK